MGEPRAVLGVKRLHPEQSSLSLFSETAVGETVTDWSVEGGKSGQRAGAGGDAAAWAAVAGLPGCQPAIMLNKGPKLDRRTRAPSL